LLPPVSKIPPIINGIKTDICQDPTAIPYPVMELIMTKADNLNLNRTARSLINVLFIFVGEIKTK
jgi:hypothetical protein